MGVFHLAHPMDMKNEEPQETKPQRAIDATLAIIKSSINSKTVKRVIYTSSAATVVYNDKESYTVDESDWSDVDFIKTIGSFVETYLISKTLTEKAALEFVEKNGVDFICVLPTFINGPSICPRLPDSVRSSMSMIFGNEIVYKGMNIYSLVYIDDVASAHIFLFGYPNAKGRYNCGAIDVTRCQMSEFLSTRYPQFPIPTPESLKECEGTFKNGHLSDKKAVGYRVQVQVWP